MGSELPPEYPELDPDKWYMATVDNYAATENEGTCEGEDPYEDFCCIRGIWVIAWIAGGFDCLYSRELCLYGEDFVQRLIFVNGPWDTEEECLEQLP